jgi:hypothetical protein
MTLMDLIIAARHRAGFDVRLESLVQAANIAIDQLETLPPATINIALAGDYRAAYERLFNEGFKPMAKTKTTAALPAGPLIAVCDLCDGAGSTRHQEWVNWLARSTKPGYDKPAPTVPLLTKCEKCRGVGAVLLEPGQILFNVFREHLTMTPITEELKATEVKANDV